MSDNAKKVVVVTDSTSDIPTDRARELDIRTVPLSVRFGDEVFLDRAELSQAEFLDRLKSSSELPKTSQPSVMQFAEAFRAAVDAGDDVVCITIASTLSGTFNSARLASESIGQDRIQVIDSKSV